MTDKNKASYTPGPWGYHFTEINPYHSYIHDEEKNCVALMDTRGGLSSVDEVEANARLIAAAPDLLQALYAVRAYLCRVHSAHVVEKEFPFLTEVIKKATGEQWNYQK